MDASSVGVSACCFGGSVGVRSLSARPARRDSTLWDWISPWSDICNAPCMPFGDSECASHDGLCVRPRRNPWSVVVKACHALHTRFFDGLEAFFLAGFNLFHLARLDVGFEELLELVGVSTESSEFFTGLC